MRYHLRVEMRFSIDYGQVQFPQAAASHAKLIVSIGVLCSVAHDTMHSKIRSMLLTAIMKNFYISHQSRIQPVLSGIYWCAIRRTTCTQNTLFRWPCILLQDIMRYCMADLATCIYQISEKFPWPPVTIRTSKPKVQVAGIVNSPSTNRGGSYIRYYGRRPTSGFEY